MQILAHPDDDLYFMNPDARQMLADGVPVVCVYVTAGESDGRNRIPGAAGVPVDKAAYASARHQGLRQAYAHLLGLDVFTAWRRDTVTLRGGARAEIDTLADGARRVELVFLNLAMHTARGNRPGLPSLWHDRALTLPTVVADGSPLRRSGGYDYDRLVDVLAGLLERYRPTVVHTLDPDPDIQLSDEATRRKDSEQRGYSDHADHTAVASFSWAAMIRRVAEATRDGGGVPAFAVTAFRGYHNRHWPKNLPRTVLDRKAEPLVPYGGGVDWACGNTAGCGDYNVGGRRPLTNEKGWIRSTRHRHPGPRMAVAAEDDGRLTAYGVLGLRAVRWRETTPGGGRWGEPEDLGGGPLAPVLGTTALPDGRRLLFGLRLTSISGHGSGDDARELVVLEQRSPGGPFRAWQGLGNPERDGDRGRRAGVPVAVTDRAGRVHLFVRNADQGVSTRSREPDGRWRGWRDLGGGAVQDGLAAVVDSAGRVHVLGAGHDTVHHWAQEHPGAAVTHRPSAGLPAPVDVPAAVAAADGTVELLFRRELDYRRASPRDGRGTADPRLVRVRPDGTVLPAPAFEGYGPVTADGTALLGRDLGGRLQVRTGDGLFTRTSGPQALGTPVLVTTASDVRVIGLGPDGHPWTWRPSAEAPS
ncbi:PIG-L family deacetylase [Streptomyces sp. t39]|nr:PIG-L family deacetylase [Streptomyces sp. t39]